MGVLLENYKWKSRLILIFTPHTENDLYKEQLAEFEKTLEKAVERDLVILEIYPGGNITAEEIKMLQSGLGVEPYDFSILLIGKDGLVKMHKTKPVKAKAIYDLIDSMPMRQQEVRKSQNSHH